MNVTGAPQSQGPLTRRSFVSRSGVIAAAPAIAAALPATAARAEPLTRPAPAAGDRAPRPDQERWRTCLDMARALLVVGPNNEDLKLTYLRTLIDDGLPRTTAARKNVLIIGAGIAGLTAGALLKQAGHHVTIIEANGNRIGGRIKTFRRDASQPTAPFGDPRLYAEAGAMRIPDFHPLTLALVDKLGLRRQLFYNVDVKPGTGNQNAPVPAVVYHAYNGQVWRRGPASTPFTSPDQAAETWILTNGNRARRSQYARSPEAVNRGFGVTGAGRGKTSGTLLDDALAGAYAYYADRNAAGAWVDKPLPQLIEGWAKLLYDFDTYSMRRYLAEQAHLDDPTIDTIGTLENITSRLDLSFLHSFTARTEINPGATYWELVGGTAELPYAMLAKVRENVRMNRRMISLEYREPGADHGLTPHLPAGGPNVWVRAVSETDKGQTPVTETFTADVAIVTIPFSSLRHVDIAPALPYRKRRAVIELHYDSATKVLLEFSRRWWEFTEADWRRELDAVRPGLYERYASGHATSGADLLGAHPSVPKGGVNAAQRAYYAGFEPADVPAVPASHVFGGGSVTDGPNRFAYNPSHQIKDSPGGVVLASYTWADDASRWDSLEEDARYPYALRGLQQIYGQRIEVFYTGHGKTQSWMRDPYAFGEAAVFAPGQFTHLHPAIPTSTGPVHFAGEHTSLKHAWIEGALESAVRTALEVNGS